MESGEPPWERTILWGAVTRSEGTRERRGEAGWSWRPHRPEDGRARRPLQRSEEEVREKGGGGAQQGYQQDRLTTGEGGETPVLTPGG